LKAILHIVVSTLESKCGVNCENPGVNLHHPALTRSFTLNLEVFMSGTLVAAFIFPHRRSVVAQVAVESKV